MNLLELQRRMSEDVRRPLTANFSMQEFSEDGQSIHGLVAAYLKPSAKLSSFERLEIYNRQYWLRVTEVVSENYPALNALLGSKRFDALILAYLHENPSTSFTLRDLGAKLPAWLADHPQFLGSRNDLAVDVARLEWAYIEAFDSLNRAPLSEEEFACLRADCVLSLQPHLQLLELRYPVDEVVLALHKSAPESDIVSNAVVEGRKADRRLRLPKVRRSTVYLAVCRFEDSVYYRRLDRENFRLLSAIREGHSIATMVDQAFVGSRMKPRQQATKIKEYLAYASELGWVTTASSRLTKDESRARR